MLMALSDPSLRQSEPIILCLDLVATFGDLAILLDKTRQVLLDPDELVCQRRHPLEPDLALNVHIGPVDPGLVDLNKQIMMVSARTRRYETFLSFLLAGWRTFACCFTAPGLGACFPLAMRILV